MRFVFTTLFLFNVLCFAAVINPNGAVRNANSADFFRHPQNVDDYNEMWSYVFVLDNGAKVYVNYTWMYVPTQGFKIGTDISIWNLKGKSASAGRQYETNRYSEDKGKNSIAIGKDYAMNNLPGVGHRVLFSANKNGKKFLDLTFSSATQGLVPGDGKFSVNGISFAQYVHIPYGRVKGRVGIGDDTLDVSGYGYMDHTWGTQKITNLATRMISFSTSNSKNFIAGRVGITKQGETFGYAIHSGTDGKPATILFPASATENGSPYNPKQFPKQLSLTWDNTEFSALAFNVSPQENFSILSNFEGFFERNIVKLALGNLIYKRGRSSIPEGKLDWVIAGF